MTYQTQQIEIIRNDGQTKETIPAAVRGCFAAHGTFQNKDRITEPFVVTHLATGAIVCKGWNRAIDAVKTLEAIDATLSNEQKEAINKLTVKTGQKNRLLRAIAEYLQLKRKIDNNIPLERQVGVFYRDRADAERMRIKLNPENNKLLDDSAILSESIIADCLMGKITV
jgi:hypothetical protein